MIDIRKCIRRLVEGGAYRHIVEADNSGTESRRWSCSTTLQKTLLQERWPGSQSHDSHDSHGQIERKISKWEKNNGKDQQIEKIWWYEKIWKDATALITAKSMTHIATVPARGPGLSPVPMVPVIPVRRLPGAAWGRHGAPLMDVEKIETGRKV